MPPSCPNQSAIGLPRRARPRLTGSLPPESEQLFRNPACRLLAAMARRGRVQRIIFGAQFYAVKGPSSKGFAPGFTIKPDSPIAVTKVKKASPKRALTCDH